MNNDDITRVKMAHSKEFLTSKPIPPSIDGRPLCYSPEKDNPYPLCVGNGGWACSKCCFYANMDMGDYFEH